MKCGGVAVDTCPFIGVRSKPFLTWYSRGSPPYSPSVCVSDRVGRVRFCARERKRDFQSTPRGRDCRGVLSSFEVPYRPCQPDLAWPRQSGSCFAHSACLPVKGQIMSALRSNASLPETGFLRQPQVLTFIPISKSTLWRRVMDGTFPAPVKLSPRVTVWRVEDVRRWIKEQSAQA